MNAPSPNVEEDNGEGAFLDESDIINEYEVDEEDLPDADEEGGSDGEEEFDGVDDSIHIFTGHTGELYTAACSPTDATLVATGGGDDKGFLWRITQGDWAFELQGHQDSVSSLSFSADGQLLASGSLDGVVKVWDITRGELKCTLDGPSGGIESCFSSSFSGHGGSVTCGDFTPDGRTICSGSDDATLRIWNPKTAEIIHVVRGHPYHTEGLTCLTINSDSSLALTGSNDGSVHVVNISTGKVVSSLSAHSDSVECGAFEASSRRDGWRAATGGMDKKLIIWDQHSSPRCICDHEEGVTCLQWLAGSRYIATGCLDGKVRIWDSLSGDCAKIFTGHSDAIQSIAISANRDFLVSVSLDGTGRVFEIAEFR
ncbi:UNVERIFIED_CONTAM: Angio-associated migratory cell protein [Sesamum radiatum]|uniref:Angio-associated migratory cell protein n=1 Tax=Sesamum radiatum TaxID=300843 RepID=A0AAW2RYD7_SESRA